MVHVVKTPLEPLRASLMVQLVEIVIINFVYSPRALLGRASFRACSLKIILPKEVTVVGNIGMVLEEPVQAFV